MWFKIDPRSVGWWFWAVTWALIAAALGGWMAGYYAVIAVSAANIVDKFSETDGLTALPVQTRIAYFLLTLPGFWPDVRFWWFIPLFVATTMTVFFDRCAITAALGRAPWNRGRPAPD